MEVQVTSSIPMKYLSLSRVRVCRPAVAINVWTCNISFFLCSSAGVRDCGSRISIFTLSNLSISKCFVSFIFLNLMINVVTARLRELEINVTQLWRGI